MPRDFRSNRSWSRRAVLAAAVGLTAMATSAQAFTIVLNPDAGLAANAPALAAFNRAALAWDSKFTDPITVTINAGLSSTGFSNANIIGQTSSFVTSIPYNTVRSQLIANAGATPSKAIIASLPTYATFSGNAQLPAGSSLTGNVYLTTADAKAAGFSVTAAADANITFNTNFNFDYDSSNGVTPGQTDFQSVATHEIGHALGFDSAVDGIGTSVTPYALDLFRFAGTTAVSAATFASGPRNFVPGTEDVTSDATVGYRMSTVSDGNQASHWKADELTGQYIGIMDPTLAAGVSENITAADLRAFELIGYDLAVVPEPTTLATLGLVGAMVLRRRRNG